MIRTRARRTPRRVEIDDDANEIDDDEPTLYVKDCDSGFQDKLSENTPQTQRSQRRDRMIEALTPQGLVHRRKSNTLQGNVSAAVRNKAKENANQIINSADMRSSLQRSTGLSNSPIAVQSASNFEEWMKLATDNKINANNSWNFALIDYFHDMSFLREGDSINFQKASATLDGCVKIYASRVDSVITETGKLLSGLASSQPDRNDRSDSQNNENDDAEDEDEEVEDGEHGTQTKKSKGKHSDSTLVSDYSTLQIKKYDLDYSIDPLFKKLAAQTNEGGARSLLMSNLSIDSHSRIVFDTSPGDEDFHEDYVESNEERERNNEFAMHYAKLLMKKESNMENMWISPLKDIDIYGEDVQKTLDKLTHAEQELAAEKTKEGSNDNFDNIGDDAIAIAAAEARAATYEDDVDTGYDDIDAWPDSQQPQGQFNPLTDLDVGDYSMTYGNEDEDNDNEQVLRIFDQSLKKNWAGPQHWRIKSMNVKKQKEGSSNEPRRRRGEKAEHFIDFNRDPDFESVFATGTVSTTIPKSQWKNRSAYILPDDLHFSSAELLKLFIKPAVRISIGRRNASGTMQSNNPLISNENNEIDAKFWAKQSKEGGGISQNKLSQTDFEAAEFREENEQHYDANFFQDGASVADITNIGMSEYQENDNFATFSEDAQDHMQALSILSQTNNLEDGPNSDPIKYARTAKRVDVKRLKENLWRCLDFGARENGSRSFRDVIRDLSRFYDDKRLEEISMSFCFICLLHLANEKGLRLEGTSDICNIKVYTDEVRAS